MENIIDALEEKLEQGYLGDEKENEEAEEEAIKYSSVIGKFVNIDDLTNSNIVYYNNGVNIDSILDYLNKGIYVLPGFQRRFVWDNPKIAYLALSIIQGVPIPPIYLYTDEERNQVILDGQQRIISIFLYFNDLEYSRSEHSIDFKAIGLLNEDLRECEKQLEVMENLENADKKLLKELKKREKSISKELFDKYGMKRCSYYVEEKDISYRKFSDKNRRYLKSKRLDTTVVESRDLNSTPHKIFANIFKLLNSGGKVLGPQEVRNGIYWKTSLYKSLYSLNNEEGTTWRKIYGGISNFSKDMEILLKILALNYYTQLNEEEDKYEINYPGFSWSKIMEDYSELRANDKSNSEKDIQQLQNYLNSISISENENKKTKTKKCQKAVFEAVFIAYCKLNIPSSFQIDYNWICNKKFEHVLSNKTSVEERVNLAVDWMKELYYAQS